MLYFRYAWGDLPMCVPSRRGVEARVGHNAYPCEALYFPITPIQPELFPTTCCVTDRRHQARGLRKDTVHERGEGECAHNWGSPVRSKAQCLRNVVPLSHALSTMEILKFHTTAACKIRPSL